MESLSSYPLRALDIGEIFDRAVTIYARNFAVFTLMVLTLLAPYSVIEYFAVPGSNATLAQTIDQIKHPVRQHGKAAPQLPSLGAFALAALAIFVLSPFVAGAVAVGVAAAYNGQRPNYRESFGKVLRRWPTLLGTTLLQICLFVAAYLLSLILLMIVFVTAELSYRVAPPMGVTLFIAGIVLALAIFFGFLLLVLAYAFSTYAAALEDVGVGAAIASAYRRVFNRREVRKALLMALSYLAIETGVVIVSTAIGFLALFVLKSYVLQLAVSAVVSSAMTAFLTIVIAIYYYDVRTRAEGLDLEVELQRLAAV